MRGQRKAKVHARPIFEFLEPRLLLSNWSGSITDAIVWDDTSEPYVIDGALTVQSGGSLTIQPGVVVQQQNHVNVYGVLAVRQPADLEMDGHFFDAFVCGFLGECRTAADSRVSATLDLCGGRDSGGMRG